jgi:hypothetical protein
MKTRSLLIKGIVLSALSVFLFANAGVVASQKERAITATGEGVILNYSEEIYWSEEQFNQEYKKYSENKEKYLKNFIEIFSDMFLEAGLEATDWIIFFNSKYDLGTGKAVDSTLVRCKINGAASGTAESPYFRTEWLLMPILPRGSDLYNFKYLTDKILVYEGTVNHTSIKITFTFSKPISHCHYHIWYK